jgi:Cytochrome c
VAAGANGSIHLPAIFESQGCKNCHRVRGEGSRQGPDLSDIGTNRGAAEIQKSILDPNAKILPQNCMVRIVAKDGNSTTGKLLNQDTFILWKVSHAVVRRQADSAGVGGFGQLFKLAQKRGGEVTTVRQQQPAPRWPVQAGVRAPAPLAGRFTFQCAPNRR